MKVQISATAPTIYQIQSLKAIASIRGIEANPDGSFEFKAIFSTKNDAVSYLSHIAYKLFEDRKEYMEAMSDIKKYGSLTYDTITARIEKT